MTPLIELDSVEHAFADGSSGLRSCTLALAQGRRHTLLGANGAGKTTLLLHLNGLLRPTAGSLRWHGRPYDYSRHGLNLMMRGGTARLALPVLLTSSPYTGWQRGLQRMEVDTTARTLVAKPLIPAAGDPSAFSPLWLERAAQIDDQLYHLSGGDLATHDW